MNAEVKDARAEREIVITRVIDVPRTRVFSAWTQPEHVERWWGPNGFTNTTREIDVRPGGVWRFVMHGPDGTDYENRILYREVVEPERLVFAHDSGVEDDPYGFVSTVLFVAQGEKTELTLRMTFASALARQRAIDEFGAIEGGKQTLGRLAAYVETLLADRGASQPVVITRLFDAPRERLWKAWTDPAHIMRWWGPEHFTSPACQVDLRVGGKYLFCMRAPDGQDFWSTGVYRELVEPERIVYTDSFADAQGNVVPAAHYGMPGAWPDALLVTVTLEDIGGKTRLTLLQEGIPAGEMSEMTAAGWNQSLDKLAQGLGA